MLTVWAVDPARVRRGQLHALECSVIVRDADVGTWQTIITDEDLSRRVVEGWRLIVQDNGRTVTSGPVTEYGSNITDRTVTLIGQDDLAPVADRIVYPDPTRPASQQTDDAYYKRSGLSGVVTQAMIQQNAGVDALAVRRVEAFAVGSAAGLGVQTTTNLRYGNLLEEARALARGGGFTFTAAQEEDNRIVLRFRAGQDLSRRVRFTQQNGGLSVGIYSIAGPTVTSVLVAGQGEGAARTVSEHTQDTDWGRRIEMFQDRRDTDDPEELDEAGRVTLAEGAAGASAKVEINEVPGLVYGIDYQLGDIVTVEFGAATISEPVRAVELVWDGHGRTARLTLGDHQEEDDQTTEWVNHVRDLGSRLRRLETR